MTAAGVESTVTPDQAAGCSWDLVIVGAGPAGAIAAREAARRGAAALLVDKAVFPRRKVCGCCVNHAAWATLEAVGLGALPAALGAQPLHAVCLAAGGHRVGLALPPGVALSREAFDTALVERAIGAGAQFFSPAAATIGPVTSGARTVTLIHQEHPLVVAARVVLVADGLAGQATRHESGLARRIAPRARLGAGAVLEHASSDYPPGMVFMGCGPGGYAGLVRLEDGRLNVAAALDAELVRRAGGLGEAVARLIAHAGLPGLDGLAEASWQGTPALTSRRASLGAERLFVLGDSAGYVEPFTGEGMAWALASGVALAPIAVEAAQRWTTASLSQWAAWHQQLVRRRQRTCRIVARGLRHPRVMAAMVAALSRFPRLAAPLVRSISAPILREAA